MTAIRRLITTVLATVGTVAGLLVTAAIAAAAPAPVNDGNAFTTSVAAGSGEHAHHHDREQRLTVVDLRPRRRRRRRRHAARDPRRQPDPPPHHNRPARPLNQTPFDTKRACAGKGAQARLVIFANIGPRSVLRPRHVRVAGTRQASDGMSEVDTQVTRC